MSQQQIYSFRKISSLEPHCGQRERDLYLTIDIDWAHDVVLGEMIDLVERADIQATWFITHETDLIHRLRANRNFELGIHPNFNFLLNGDDRNGNDMRHVLERLLKFVPEAVSLRSHSLTSSTKLLQMMPEYGLTHESNIYIPSEHGFCIGGFPVWNSVVRVVHTFEDDLHLLSGMRKQAFGEYMLDYVKRLHGPKIMDFHPIHVYLNSDDMDRYEQSRQFHLCPDELSAYRYTGEGIRTAFDTILGINS